LQFPAGSPALPSVGSPAWQTGRQDACHLKFLLNIKHFNCRERDTGAIKPRPALGAQNRGEELIPFNQVTSERPLRYAGFRGAPRAFPGVNQSEDGLYL